MNPNDTRMINLKRAAAVTDLQRQAIQAQLRQMPDDMVMSMIDENDDLREMLTVDANNDNGGIVVNYANQPQNQTISFQPPWEVNLSSVPTTPQQGFFQNNVFNGYWMDRNDPRVKAYTPGMRLYGINPMAFFTAEDMVGYYEMLELSRKRETDFNYAMLTLNARANGEDVDWAEDYKFKTADQIVQEQEEAQRKAQQAYAEQMSASTEDNGDIVYDVYDARGFKFQKAVSFSVIDSASKEVIKEYKCHKDKNGQSYVITYLADERKKQYEMQMLQYAFARQYAFLQTFRQLFLNDYYSNLTKWDTWKQQGLSIGQMAELYENERVDWNKHQKLIERAIATSTYSRRKFSDILKDCCGAELDYLNRPQFFGLSYDFERDMRYKELISTPEQLQNDPIVNQKLASEYEIRRKIFLDKVKSGNLAANMQQDAGVHPTVGKPCIDSLTLADFDKPENHIMYSQIYNPTLATPNMFIPKLDSNGQPIPIERTVGRMTVDDDTGQVVSQEEVVLEASDSMTNDELSSMF